VPDVFISYNREDRETARLFANALEAEGFSVWWDAALRAGETYDEVTEQNLRSAGAVVVLWSKRSSNSKWVRAEATVGERSSTLVPALIEDCERPIRFELVQTADLRHWRGDRNDPHWRAFMQDIRTAVSRRSAKPAPPPAAATTSAQDVNIETTFWNSIKDGADRSDFEAYLKRYPNGYFAALAQNRIASLARPAAATQRMTTAEPQRPMTAQPQRPTPPPQQPRAQAQPTPRQQAQPAPKKSAGGMIAGVAVIALGVIGVVAFQMTRGGDKPAEIATPAQTPPPPDVVAAIAEEPTQDAAAEGIVDVFAEGAVAPLEESVDAIDIPAEAAEPIIEEAAPSSPVAGKTFRDCESCPLMATLPGGAFTMGSPSSEAGHNAYEGPQREVTVKSFAIGVYEVTNAEWKACVDDGACKEKPSPGAERFPALFLSWRDAADYASWLSKKSGRKYRLPTEAEWEYAARAGAATPYWWGEKFERAKVAKDGAAAVGSLDANAFGLYDVAGNAREWVADCYVNNFTRAPTDGAAVTDGDCGRRVIRGGSWESAPADTRVANRSRIDIGVRARYMGVRLALDIN